MLRPTASRVRHAVWALYVSPRLLGPLDRLLLSGRTSRVGADHVLIGPPGGGNIGDQAMVEAFLERTDGPVVVVGHEPGGLTVPPASAHRARVVTLPALVYGGGLGHLRDVLRLRRLLEGASSLSVVGADLMDGGYGYRGASALARTAELARRRGLPSRVLGFSWNASPDPRARRALRRAARAGVQLMLRDPVSAARARADGLTGVTEAADTVFSATRIDVRSAAEVVGADQEYAVVNVSGLVHARRDLVDPFSTLVAHLRRRGLRVVLLPHVRRPGGDDVAVCRQVAAGFAGDDGVRLVDGIWLPEQVRGLVDGAHLVLTGRMHLAIMALSRGVPAVCLSTQGKVEGLMDLFGTGHLSVEPDGDLAARLVAVADEALDTRDELAARIAARSVQVKALSLKNFQGL